jgi:hypothetical protein
MKVQEYLKSHPGIRVSWLEKCLGLTHGTLRIGRIPKHHIAPIEVILADYGYEKEGATEVQGTFVTKNSVIGHWDGALFIREPLKDGTIVRL